MTPDKERKAAMTALKVGDEIWMYRGAIREATITEVLADGVRVWGYRVRPLILTRTDHERGEVVGMHSVYARPSDRQRLANRLMEDADALYSASRSLLDHDAR
jgi:hypothetical protein